MVGNYENIGYARQGFESIYNIAIMEEVDHILAFGAGVISKRLNNKSIVRMEQPKDVRTYFKNLPELIKRNGLFLILMKVNLLFMPITNFLHNWALD